MTGGAKHSWKAIRDRIHARILDRTYAPGDKLPRDADLAADFGCARSTIQRAMRDLADSGIVLRRRKGGTHVRSDPVTRAIFEIPVTRKEVEQRGSQYGYHLISSRIERTPPPVAAKLGLSRPARMLHIEALHLADHRPYILEDRWVCTDTVPEILEVDVARQSANEWLVHNKPYSRCDLRFYAIQASAETAQQLDTAVGTALLVMDRTTWIGTAPITTVQAVTAPGYQLVTRI